MTLWEVSVNKPCWIGDYNGSWSATHTVFQFSSLEKAQAFIEKQNPDHIVMGPFTKEIE